MCPPGGTPDPSMGFARGAPEAEPRTWPDVALGIDLGTSFTRVAVWRDGDVASIPDENGSVATPSWVAFTDEGVLIGDAARDQANGNMENSIFAPQRLIGFRIDNPWVQWYMRHWPSKMERGEDDRPLIQVWSCGQERRFRPEELVAVLFARLRHNAEHQLGRTVTHAVVTVPANYGENQRKAIVVACNLAGLSVMDLIKAPSAGAVAYTLSNKTRDRGHILVCDMGSSYFDFSLVSVDGHVITERAFGTDYVDLDKNILQYCLEDLREKWGLVLTGDRRAMARLQRACEIAKTRLSQYSQARVEVMDLAHGVDYSCVVSRSHFEELCRDEIGPLLEPIAWCLEDCGLERENVLEVVIVGGSAHIPVLKRAIRDFFHGLRPTEVNKPERAAVLGAAAYAAALVGQCCGELPVQLKGLELQQVLPWAMAPGCGQAGEPAPRSVETSRDRPPAAGQASENRTTTAPPKPQTRANFSELLPPRSLQGDMDVPRPPRDFDADSLDEEQSPESTRRGDP